jgi:hypothetical protein
MPIFDNATYTAEELNREGKVGRVLLDQMIESGEVVPFENPGKANHYDGHEVNEYMRKHRNEKRNDKTTKQRTSRGYRGEVLPPSSR